MITGILCPILSASFPEGIRDSILVVPLIPKKRAMRDDVRRRFSSACIAKSVMKKAFTKEKVSRRQVKTNMLREEPMALNDSRRFMPLFS